MNEEVIRFPAPNPEYQKKVLALVSTFKRMHQGDVLLHPAIAQIIGEEYQSDRYYRIACSARKRLLEEGFNYLRPVRGQGYSRSKDYEHLRAGGQKFRESMRKWRYGRKIFEHLDERSASQRVLDQRVHAMRVVTAIEDAVVGTVRSCIKSVAAAEVRPRIG